MYADASKWEVCLEIATTITRIDPQSPFGWIHKAHALHELKRTREAWDTLLPVADQFSRLAVPPHVIPYNLARYACQLGRSEVAKAWLAWAFTVSGDAFALKLMALEEPDFRTLWAHIEGM